MRVPVVGAGINGIRSTWYRQEHIHDVLAIADRRADAARASRGLS